MSGPTAAPPSTTEADPCGVPSLALGHGAPDVAVSPTRDERECASGERERRPIFSVWRGIPRAPARPPARSNASGPKGAPDRMGRCTDEGNREHGRVLEVNPSGLSPLHLGEGWRPTERDGGSRASGFLDGRGAEEPVAPDGRAHFQSRVFVALGPTPSGTGMSVAP